MVKTDKNTIVLTALIVMQPILDIMSYFAIKTNMTAITSVLRRPNAAIYVSLLLAYVYYVCKIKKESDYEG